MMLHHTGIKQEGKNQALTGFAVYLLPLLLGSKGKTPLAVSKSSNRL